MRDASRLFHSRSNRHVVSRSSEAGFQHWQLVGRADYDPAGVGHLLRQVRESHRHQPNATSAHSRSLQAQQGLLDAVLKWQGVGEKLVQDRVSSLRPFSPPASCERELNGDSGLVVQVVQGNVVKSTLLQVIILVSALAIKPLLRATNNDYSSSSTTSTIFYWLFHVSSWVDCVGA